MVLDIDICNTNVVIGGFQENQILFVERVSTNQNATSLELAISIKTILEIYQIQTTEIEGCIISSVVPSINHAVRKAVEKIAHCPVLLVGPGVKTGLQIAIDNPAQLGSDRVADAVAALHEYQPPIVIIDIASRRNWAKHLPFSPPAGCRSSSFPTAGTRSYWTTCFC